MTEKWVSEEKLGSQWKPMYLFSSVNANQSITSNKFVPASGVEELQINSDIDLLKRMAALENEIRELKQCFYLQVPLDIRAITKDILKPKGKPFDPSQYNWKPSFDALKKLKKILEEV